MCAILVDDIMGNNHLFILNFDQWFRRRCHLKNKFKHDAHHTKGDR